MPNPLSKQHTDYFPDYTPIVIQSASLSASLCEGQQNVKAFHFDEKMEFFRSEEFVRGQSFESAFRKRAITGYLALHPNAKNANFRKSTFHNCTTELIYRLPCAQEG